MNRRKGFTLVELLVVIAIIALLMGILLPALSRVRRSAQGAACMVQMKQWATVYSMYTGDFDGYFVPDYYPENVDDGKRCDWWIVLESYYKDLNLLRCPAATKLNCLDDSDTNNDKYDEGGKHPFSCVYMGANSNGELYRISYSYNYWMGVAVNETRANNLHRYSAWRWATVNRIKQPNSVPVVGDTIGHARKFPHATTTPEAFPDVLIGGKNCVATNAVDRIIEFCLRRHGPQTNPNINMGFADFSVRPVGLKALWSLNWHRNWVVERKDGANKDMTGKWPDWMEGYSEDGVINYQ